MDYERRSPSFTPAPTLFGGGACGVYGLHLTANEFEISFQKT